MSEVAARPTYETCTRHKCERDTWMECRSCGGDGEKFFEGDYEGDWLQGYHCCTSCGGSGGWYECIICFDEDDNL